MLRLSVTGFQSKGLRAAGPISILYSKKSNFHLFYFKTCKKYPKTSKISFNHLKNLIKAKFISLDLFFSI